MHFKIIENGDNALEYHHKYNFTYLLQLPTVYKCLYV